MSLGLSLLFELDCFIAASAFKASALSSRIIEMMRTKPLYVTSGMRDMHEKPD